jgi:hypothetical protein
LKGFLPEVPQLETSWGCEFLQPGGIEIWYSKDYTDPKLPTSIEDLTDTHVKLGSIKATGKGHDKLNGEQVSLPRIYSYFATWQNSQSANEAIKTFCNTLDVHMIMKHGDIIVYEGVMYVIKPLGIEPLEGAPVKDTLLSVVK